MCSNILRVLGLSDFTNHSRTLMNSEDLKIEQIGTQKSDLSALLIEGIHASRFQN